MVIHTLVTTAGQNEVIPTMWMWLRRLIAPCGVVVTDENSVSGECIEALKAECLDRRFSTRDDAWYIRSKGDDLVVEAAFLYKRANKCADWNAEVSESRDCHFRADFECMSVAAMLYHFADLLDAPPGADLVEPYRQALVRIAAHEYHGGAWCIAVAREALGLPVVREAQVGGSDALVNDGENQIDQPTGRA